jgi:hypothetical protein
LRSENNLEKITIQLPDHAFIGHIEAGIRNFFGSKIDDQSIVHIKPLNGKWLEPCLTLKMLSTKQRIFVYRIEK